MKYSIPEIRALLLKVLPLSADLDAFCLDLFPEIYQKYTNSLNRTEKINILIEHFVNTPDRIVDTLRLNYPEKFAEIMNSSKAKMKKRQIPIYIFCILMFIVVGFSAFCALWLTVPIHNKDFLNDVDLLNTINLNDIGSAHQISEKHDAYIMAEGDEKLLKKISVEQSKIHHNAGQMKACKRKDCSNSKPLKEEDTKQNIFINNLGNTQINHIGGHHGSVSIIQNNN